MSFIQIIKVPEGEAPEEIRRAWVGLKLPCQGVVTNGKERIGFIVGQKDENGVAVLAGILVLKHIKVGCLSGKLLPTQSKTFGVNQAQALEALQCKDSVAAQWWKDHGFPQSPKALFSFGGDEAIEIA